MGIGIDAGKLSTSPFMAESTESSSTQFGFDDGSVGRF